MTVTDRPYRTRRDYSNEQRAEALSLLAVYGGNTTRVSRETGIPRATIAQWRQINEAATGAYMARTPATEPIEFADLLARVIESTAKRIIELAESAENVRELATAMGIAFDKLLDIKQGRRGHTVNVDARSVQLGAGLSDDERRALLVSAIGQAAVAALPPDHDDGSAATAAIPRGPGPAGWPPATDAIEHD